MRVEIVRRVWIWGLREREALMMTPRFLACATRWMVI